MGFLWRKQSGAVEPKSEDDINFNIKHEEVKMDNETLDNVYNGNVFSEEDLMSDGELDDLVNGNQAPEEETKKAA